MAVTTDASKTGVLLYSSGTWANRSASGVTNALYFATDVGENGTLFQWNGTRWRVLNGTGALKTLGASASGITNSETIVLQASLPAGSWQTNDLIRIRDLSISKSGTTDTGNLSIRIGTAGTTADTVVTGASALGIISAANTTYGGEFELKLVSATSAQKTGNSGSAPFAGGNSTTLPAATTISDASANALFITATLASTGVTNTLAIQSGRIELVTP